MIACTRLTGHGLPVSSGAALVLGIGAVFDTPRRTPPRRGEKALLARSASEGYVDSRSAMANALAGASG